MRMHVVRHVPFEGPGLIAAWANEHGYQVTESSALTEEYPPVQEVDLLVVLGGPMAADDHAGNPWLLAEKGYLSGAITAGCCVLGVCLGAQILAEAIGGAVRRNHHPEIGFYPVFRTQVSAPVFSAFPDGLVVGHWHGDTFELPPAVPSSLESAATPNQAFSLHDGRVVGLQFHLEWTPDAVKALIDASSDELSAGSRWVSSASALLEGVQRHEPACRDALWALLDRMVISAKEGR